MACASQAGHLDVIGFTLNEDCTLGQHLEIVDDFNEWGKAFGYRAEVAAPLFNNDMATHYWLGRSADNETFGKAYDAWEAGQADADSVPAKINARFEECGEENTSRNAYMTFP